MLKRIVSLVLTLVLVLGTIPWHAKPVEAATTLTLQQLMEKFPAGKYWNHANGGRGNNNPDGWTDTPCSCHGRDSCVSDGHGDCRCNYFDGGVQCFGFAYKLAYDAYGTYASGWPNGTLSTLKAGDVIRYKKNGHSIWVTAVNGDTITYADCNYEATGDMCIIRWNNTISKYKVSQTLTWIKSAPYELSGGNTSCSCSEAYAGWYQVTDPDFLSIRDRHSASANELGRMPGGEVVYISKATGTGKGNWGHVTYNGISGYCAMGLLSAYQGEVHADLGTNFYAPIFNKEHWKIIENSNGVVQTATETRSANQLWRFERQSDGSYFIRSCVDGTFLDVYGAYTDMGTTVQTCWETGSPAQRWFIYEDGDGYVLRTALNNYVLDLPNNDPTNGNSLQIWERNGTGAQRWAIYRGEECQLTAPTLSVNVGNSASSTQFTWNDVYGERNFNLRIWKDVLWEGESYYDAWDVDVYSVTEVLLPAGTYHAYIDAANYFDVKPSNIVTFTVQDPQEYTLRYNANGGTDAPSSQVKYSLVPLTLSSQIPAGKSYTVSFEPNGGMLEAYSKEVSQSFVSWNTAADGSGISYTPGTTYSVDESATLYAQWEDATLGSAEDLRRDGYYFLGWYDSDVVDSEGKPIGCEYTDSSIIKGNITLYAMWTPADTLYFGDVDLNGLVEFHDILAIRLYMADRYTPECDAEEFLLRADLNRDGQLSDADTEIIRSVLIAEISVEELHASYENAGISADVRSDYRYGEELDKSELAMQIHFSEGVSYSVTNGLQVHGYDPYRIGKQTLTVSFYQFEAVYEVQVECTHENKQCIPATGANCTDSGNNQYYICNICNEVLKADGKTKTTVDEEIIAATGHRYTFVVTAPTCTAQGYTTHTCGICGDSYKDAYTDAKGHSYSYAVEKEPTVTAEGSLKGTCSKCSDTTSVVLPNLNTKDYTYEVVKEPTDTEIGIGKFTWETDAHGKFEFRIELDERKAVLSKIEVVSAPAKTTYEIGESLDTTGLTLKATYSDDSTKTITSGFTCSGFDSSSAGEKTVTVTYNGKSASFTVTVEEVEAVDPNAPRIVVESETVSSGGTVTLEVEIANNPGFSYLKLAAVYDSAVFEFVGATNGTISNEDFEVSGKNMLWSTDADAESDGLLVTLTFKVKGNAEEGEYAVGVRLIECFNGDEEEVPLTLTNGMVRITDIIYGDVNGDSKVDGRDMIRLKKYLANYDDETGISTVEIFDGADCNGDNKVNGRDLIRLKKYLANYDDETGSSTVVLGP